MTIVHIEKISTGLWTIFANFKTELKQVTIVLHGLEQLIPSTILSYQKTLHTRTDDLCYSYEYENVRHIFVSKLTNTDSLREKSCIDCTKLLYFLKNFIEYASYIEMLITNSLWSWRSLKCTTTWHFGNSKQENEV